MMVDDVLAYFLDLRLRARGRPEALAIIDRCLRLIAEAEAASDAATLGRLDSEVDDLRAELEARFGRKAPLRAH
ncbi:MAG: hypothetical protein DI570_08835 [Phenylobacterium zucineum]|nr:MAG: hypothetical protein DI570_08835 [Phenylobacterium zucineum]